MKTVRQFEREAKQLFRFCQVAGNVDEHRVRLVTERVLESKRRGYLLLLERFLRFLKHEYARHAAEIESTVRLPDDLRTRTQSRLAEIYGPGLSHRFIDNPDLIGGMRIKVGSDVYDSSVRYGLSALARRFGITQTNGRRVAS